MANKVNEANYINYIIEFESQDMTVNDVLELFSFLLKTGLAWKLQGFYGRCAVDLIRQRLLSESGEILAYVGNSATVGYN